MQPPVFPYFSMPPFFVDLHIHSARYSSCAPALDPQKLVRVLHERMLCGGVLAEHDQLWQEEEVEEVLCLAKEDGIEGVHLYRGVEITTEHAHIVAIGMEDLRDTPRGVRLERLIAVAREQGAALIWVHPYLNYSGLLPPEQHDNVEELAKGIHAVEVCSSVTRKEFSARARLLSEKWQWVPVGGSDAHALEIVGAAATEFPLLPKDEKALAKAIMAGQCGVCCTPLIKKVDVCHC